MELPIYSDGTSRVPLNTKLSLKKFAGVKLHPTFCKKVLAACLREESGNNPDEKKE